MILSHLNRYLRPAKTYYVDAINGSNSNPGNSEHSALQTIAAVNALSLLAGDRVLFKGDGSWANQQLAPVRSGVPGRYIKYGMYGGGNRPIISNPATCPFYIADEYHDIWIESIDFAGSTGSYSTVYCYNAHDLYFYNCIMRDALARHGASVNGDVHIIYNITLDTCEFYNNYKSGILADTVTGHDISIKNCIAHHNGHDASADHGFYIGGGVVVDNCLAYLNSAGGFKENDNEVQPFYYPTVKNSISYGNYYGLILTHKNALAYNNLIYENVYNMLVYGNAWGGYKVYFNTFSNSTGTAYRSIIFSTGISLNSEFKNNLFVQDAAIVNKANLHFDDGLGMSDYAAMFNYNTYYYSTTTPTAQHIVYSTNDIGAELKDWTEWQAAGAEANGTLLTALPEFVTRYTDLHPQDLGNLKGLGLALVGYNQDKSGNARIDPPTQGCYETAS